MNYLVQFNEYIAPATPWIQGIGGTAAGIASAFGPVGAVVGGVIGLVTSIASTVSETVGRNEQEVAEYEASQKLLESLNRVDSRLWEALEAAKKPGNESEIIRDWERGGPAEYRAIILLRPPNQAPQISYLIHGPIIEERLSALHDVLKQFPLRTNIIVKEDFIPLPEGKVTWEMIREQVCKGVKEGKRPSIRFDSKTVSLMMPDDCKEAYRQLVPRANQLYWPVVRNSWTIKQFFTDLENTPNYPFGNFIPGPGFWGFMDWLKDRKLANELERVTPRELLWLLPSAKIKEWNEGITYAPSAPTGRGGSPSGYHVTGEREGNPIRIVKGITQRPDGSFFSEDLQRPVTASDIPTKEQFLAIMKRNPAFLQTEWILNHPFPELNRPLESIKGSPPITGTASSSLPGVYNIQPVYADTIRKLILLLYLLRLRGLA